MLKKKMTGKILIFVALSITGLLSGCTSYSDNTSQLAQKQAKSISMNLPVKSGDYTLVSAQHIASSIKMTIIGEAQDQTAMTPDAFLERFQYQMCVTPTIKVMMNNGIDYIITINDIRSGNRYQRKLDRTSCGKIKM